MTLAWWRLPSAMIILYAKADEPDLCSGKAFCRREIILPKE
jgi:hypothetical protein